MIAALLILLGIASAAAAEGCPRGSLDARYCDRDGDLVADVPSDPKQWIDPKTIIFSYAPTEDPAVYVEVWDDFLKHMERVTGRKVQLFQVQNYAAQLEALRAGRLHVAGVNTGSNPMAVNCAGFVPFAMMAGAGGLFGYEMEIIVPAGSPITTPEQLRGRTVAFVSPTSNSGFKAPAAILKADFGLEADKDYRTTFSGKHDNSIFGVVNGDYEAAAVANSVLKQMAARGAFDPRAIRSIYRSQTFPTTGYGHIHNLRPDLAAKIREAFFTYPWEGTALKKEFVDQDRFVPISYKKDWDVIRKIDAATGVTYDCK